VDWPIRAIDFLSIEENPVSAPGDARVDPCSAMINRKMQSMTLNPHFTASHGVASDDA
jgi:hypothetical protein